MTRRSILKLLLAKFALFGVLFAGLAVFNGSVARQAGWPTWVIVLIVGAFGVLALIALLYVWGVASELRRESKDDGGAQ